MANLILPRRFTQQPQYSVEIAWDNPFTKGLISCIEPINKLSLNYRDLVSNANITNEYTDTSFGTIKANGGKVGSCLGVSCGTDNANWILPRAALNAKIALTNEVTMLVVTTAISQDILGNTSFVRTHSGGNNEHYPFTDDSIYLSSFATGRWVNGVAAASFIYSPHVSIITFKNGDAGFYVNGTLMATGSRAENPTIGDVGLGKFGKRGYFSHIALWNRILNKAEINELSRNPWQLYKKRSQVLYFDTASSGATHASSGALTADSAVVAGSSVHTALHASSGALTAQSATTAGTALHSIPHASSGAMDAQSATVAGTSAHITMHPSSGALSAQNAVIDGTADHTVPGIVTHYSSGALTAQDSVIDGTATHIVNHQSSGALASGDATVSGASIHNLTHATSGDLIADNATISGSYQGGTAVVSQASGGASSQGRPSRNRKQRLILIDTIEEVEDLLDQVDEVIKEEPKKKKNNWKKAKPAPDYGTEPQDVINRLDFYTAQLDQLRDQNRAKELKQQLEQNAAIYRQLLVKRASDAMILANNAKIREEEDIMLLLMAA